MATIAKVLLIDDLDGSEADETVSFALDGNMYEMELSKANATKLREALWPFKQKARAGGQVPRRKTSKHHATSQTPSGATAAEIRAWAKGVDPNMVTDRGQIPLRVIEAYNAAH
ncbi:histone-like nucleoid-structuring protein Lsr2 [Actinomadura oligospora]|uniref:histone-like nucleoid-structuring protein Lsr2 n=1 Tax=Actinomadura oligospora TaxID=111804 RepID=UPI00047AD0B2|nr:Lsr2 family protein [Actinomadura oligospora]